MNQIQNFKQECDRCAHPNRVAVTQCFDCAREIAQNKGSQDTELKPFKICMACDKIIHEISYKKSHQRAPYIPPIHRAANHVTCASAEIHQMIRRSSSRDRSQLSTENVTPHDTQVLGEFLTNETAQIKEQFMSDIKQPYNDIKILKTDVNSGSLGSLHQRSTPKLGIEFQNDTERSGYFGQENHQISQKQFEIIGFRESSSSIAQNEPVVQQLLPGKDSKKNLSKESSNFQKASTSRGDMNTMRTNSKLHLDRSSSRELNSQHVNTYESNPQIHAYLNRNITDAQSLNPDSFRYQGYQHQHDQLKVIDNTLNSSNLDGISNYGDSVQVPSKHQLSRQEQIQMAHYLPVQMNQNHKMSTQQSQQNAGRVASNQPLNQMPDIPRENIDMKKGQSPYYQKQVFQNDHYKDSMNSSRSSKQLKYNQILTNEDGNDYVDANQKIRARQMQTQDVNLPLQMAESSSRNQINARGSIDKRHKSSGNPESSDDKESYYLPMNFEEQKTRSSRQLDVFSQGPPPKPEQSEVQVQTDTFLAMSQPSYPNKFEQDPTLTMNLREQLQHQNALISDLRKENSELKYLLDRETESKKKQHTKYQEFEGQVTDQIKQLEFSVKHYQKMIEDLMKKHSEEIKSLNRQFSEEKRHIMAEHESVIDKIKLQHKLVSETQKEYLNTLEGDNALKDKHIKQITEENENLKKDIEVISDMAEKRLDRQVNLDQNIEAELSEKVAILEAKNVELQKECFAVNEENQVLEKENTKLRKEHTQLKEQKVNLAKIVYGKGVKAGTPVAGAAPKVKMHRKLSNISQHKTRSSLGVQSTIQRKSSVSALHS